MSRRTVGKNFLSAEEIVQSLQDLSSDNSASENEDKNEIESNIPLYASDSDSSFDFEIHQLENQHNISSSSSDNEIDDIPNIVCTTNTAQEKRGVIEGRNRGRKRNRGKKINQQANSNESNSDEQIAKDGTIWKKISQNTSGRRPMHNVLRENPGPSSYAKRKISFENASSAWRLFLNEKILKNVQHCTRTEAVRRSGDNNWKDRKSVV